MNCKCQFCTVDSPNYGKVMAILNSEPELQKWLEKLFEGYIIMDEDQIWYRFRTKQMKDAIGHEIWEEAIKRIREKNEH